MDLRGKHVIALGERDGVQGPAIEAVVRAAGAADVTAFTQCFV
jgi:betaine reductase